MNDAELFRICYDNALTETVQRLSRHADSLTVEDAFRAGWQACVNFNQRAEIAHRDEHSERAMRRHNAIRPTQEEVR